jgi:hypothetical protein
MTTLEWTTLNKYIDARIVDACYAYYNFDNKLTSDEVIRPLSKLLSESLRINLHECTMIMYQLQKLSTTFRIICGIRCMMQGSMDEILSLVNIKLAEASGVPKSIECIIVLINAAFLVLRLNVINAPAILRNFIRLVNTEFVVSSNDLHMQAIVPKSVPREFKFNRHNMSLIHKRAERVFQSVQPQLRNCRFLPLSSIRRLDPSLSSSSLSLSLPTSTSILSDTPHYRIIFTENGYDRELEFLNAAILTLYTLHWININYQSNTFGTVIDPHILYDS